MRDDRIGPGLYADVLDVLARHGFSRGDDQHAGRAVVLIGDLARIFEGSQDHPMGYSRNQVTHLAPADGSRAGRLQGPGSARRGKDRDVRAGHRSRLHA